VIRVNTNRILELQQYNKAQMKVDIEKLRELLRTQEWDEEEIEDHFKEWGEEAAVHNAAGEFWKICEMTAKQVGRGSTSTWNSILRMLGYDVIVDRGGAIIYEDDEPAQAVFLTRSALEIVELITNRESGSKITDKILGDKDYNLIPGFINNSTNYQIKKLVFETDPIDFVNMMSIMFRSIDVHRLEMYRNQDPNFWMVLLQKCIREGVNVPQRIIDIINDEKFNQSI